MQSKIRLLTAVALCMSIAFVSCKKNDTTNPTTDQTTELTAHSDDETTVSTETDALADDANIAIESNASFNGKVENTLGTICNATAVADSTSDIKKITLTYSGLNCAGNRSYAGVVVLSMAKGAHWKDAGAVLTINVQNLKITRVRDNKSVVINGIKTITNVSGGKIKDLASRGTITNLIASNGITLTFDNGTQRTWQIAKQRVFTYNNGIVITTSGTHTEGAVTGIAEWGLNRFGNAFTTSTTTPLVVREDCNYRLVSGEVKHSRLAADITVTFGLDASGAATTCPGTGTYYFKLVWAGANGLSKTVILPY